MPAKRTYIYLKSSTRDFENSLPFNRSSCFYLTITGDFEHFQYCKFETSFVENENLFLGVFLHVYWVES